MYASVQCANCLPIAPIQCKRVGQRRTSLRQWQCVKVQAKKRQQQEQEVITTPVASNEPKDFWEGENWDIVGTIGQWTLPLLVIMAIATGFFAASSYDDGATVFLATPAGPDGSAKLLEPASLQ